MVLGGYDNRVAENVSYHKELVQLAESLDLKTATVKTVVTALNIPDDVDVLFLLSVPKALKDQLLKSATLLMYTPSNEHFGIVPLEAMLVGVPVLAANTGGPLETVVEGETGWLRAPDEIESWTEVINNVLHKMSKENLRQMGSAGKQRVKQEFSETKMAERFDELIVGMENAQRKECPELSFLVFSIFVLLVDGLMWITGQTRRSTERHPTLPRLPPLTPSILLIFGWSVYLFNRFSKSAQIGRTPDTDRRNR